ncbi:hypothetical protein H5410_021359 [Solanum commersonii]|uniref:Uncharacterized protein n=1 Tax=Solanum commersonii TaxID=4109 RepID=A0A9J5ZGY6_SOLCO|nr:hypothetical protein H5410_021359 [Solanum commersonii]
MNTFINNNKFNKKKAVFIMGAKRTGKSHLFVDLAIHFRGEIINLDKMQVYKGLEIVTNKITHTEKQGVKLSQIPTSRSNFFCVQAIVIEFFLKTQCVPIIVGESNSYIKKHVEDPVFMFKYKYDSCFIWIDVEQQSVLNHRFDMKVDEMGYWMRCGNFSSRCKLHHRNPTRNTRILICNQLDKIQRLINEKCGWCIILLRLTFSKMIEQKLLTKHGGIPFCNHA